ncbi:MAG TPA: TonB-dependent receptor, partial [Candidatus Dormibacteraeota bacterium]|nr:TonB-dependent receptor [Candidatus Dormibacteraeota bacterium]
YLAIALVAFAATGGRLWAQAQTATITGTATDTSGAALAGAKITVTNTETNASQSTVTNAQGLYSVPDLPVGTYSIAGSQSGFQTSVKTGVTLTVGSTVVENLTLPVGQVSQTVSVEANAVQVETQTSQVSNLVAPRQVANLPLNGRNIEQLLTLTPGVTAMAPTVNFVTGRMYGMQNDYSISGGRPTGQMFLLDGTDIRDFWEHGIGSGYAATELGISSISQFQVITSNGNAQYAGNGIVSEVSKSGTNDFHGSAYEYFRNSALDARDAPDIAAGLSAPPPFRQNQFGADIGGPIKKDKLFFFANYEGLRNSLSTTIPGLGISEPYVAQGMLPCYDIYGNPVNTAPSSGSCPGTPAGSQATGGTTPVPVGNATIDPILGFTGNGNTAQIQQIASLYALCKQCRAFAEPVTLGSYPSSITIPQLAGTDFGGYSYVSTSQPLTVDENYVLGRIDYNIGTNDSMFGRYVLDRANVGNGPQDPLGIFPESDFTRNQYLTIAENHIVSPTMVNVLRFGFVRTAETMSTALGLSSAQLSAVGLTSDPLNLVRTLYGEPQRPDAQVTPYNATPLGPDPNRPNIYDNKFSFGDDLSWTHGSHTLKLGMVVTRVQVNVNQVSYAAGNTYGFGSMANTLLGSSSFGFFDPPGFANSTRYFREIDIAPYFQDDWRVTSQLTLNLGLRYDYGTNPVGWAGGNQPLTVLTGSFLPPVGPVAPTPACVSGLGATPSPLDAAHCALQYFTPVKHAFANNPNSNNWEPRFGFAYSPFKNNKTAIRGGIGVFVDPTAARIYESGFTATPPASSFLIIGPAFPNAFDPTATCLAAFGLCPSPSEFAGVTYQDNTGSPYTIQYNFEVQQQITPGTVLTVSYVGSVARHLWNQRDINPPKCQNTFPNCTALPQIPKSLPTASNATYTVVTGANCVPNPNGAPAFGLAANQYQASCYGSGIQLPFATIFGVANSPQNRINPAFGSMITEAATAASSYNSLQVGLNHQFSRSLSGQVNYTYSHCIDNGSFATSLEQFAQLQTNPYNQAYDYENCDFDVRHNLSVNGIYALPFKGDRLVSGWQIATILGVHSGLPINVYNGGAIDPANIGSEWASRANYSFAPGCSPNHIIDKAISPGVIQWFDPSCYQPQAPGFYGNIRRNSLPGPGTLDLDLSILKNTKITEKVNMQFRAEAFNVMNHYNPGAPGGGIFLSNGQDGQSRTSQSPIVTPRQIQFALKFDF